MREGRRGWGECIDGDKGMTSVPLTATKVLPLTGRQQGADTDFAPGLLHTNRRNGLVLTLPLPSPSSSPSRFALIPNAPFLFGF